MAGPRSFPSLVNDLPGVNQASFEGLQSYEKPFLTIWGSNDAGAQGSLEAQQFLIDSVPGAEGQPHARIDEAGHFLQDDQGEEIATRLIEFYQANGIAGVDPATETGNTVGRVIRLRQAIRHRHRAADNEHDRGGLLRERRFRGPLGAMARISVANRIESLSPANVDAALQSEAFDDADSLLLSLASERPGIGLRGIGRHLRG